MTVPTRGEANRNPGNIRWNEHMPWLGLADPPHDSGDYCIFVDDFHGLRALAKDLYNKWARGLRTVEAIVKVYAPNNENDTASYIKDVCTQLGVNPGTLLDLTQKGNLVAFMRAVIRHENGRIACDPVVIAQAAQAVLADAPR